MPLFRKLREIFSDRQGAAEKRVAKLIAEGAEWPQLEPLVFPPKGPGPRVSAVVAAVIAEKRWPLLTPIAAQAGDWIGIIDLVYRKNELGSAPAGRPQELEGIYQALKAAKKHGKKLAQDFVTSVENWSCLKDSEACFDWARAKPEFVPVPAAGLVALADRPVQGSALAVKVLASGAEIDRAVDTVEWFYADKGMDRDTAIGNLAEWRKALEEMEKKKDNNKGGPMPPPAAFKP
jgi:hypothetical protein